MITGLISFISVAEACPGELACISRRFECGNVCWFAYGNGSFRKLNNDELTDYFGRGIFFPTKSYLTMMGSDMNIKKTNIVKIAYDKVFDSQLYCICKAKMGQA